MSLRETIMGSMAGLAALGAVGEASADALATIESRGEMKVGLALFEPWAMQSKVGRLMGFEVEVARRVAADIGVDVRFVQMPFDDLITALEQERIDVVISGFSITPQRALRVAFSRPYATSGVGLAVDRARTAAFTSVAQLDDPAVAIGAPVGTTAAELAARVFPKARLETFEDDNAAFDALLAGKVQAVLSASPKPRFEALRHPERIAAPLERRLLETAEAFAVRRGEHDLLNVLNAWVEARTRDGWLASAHSYWFGGLEWFDDVAR